MKTRKYGVEMTFVPTIQNDGEGCPYSVSFSVYDINSRAAVRIRHSLAQRGLDVYRADTDPDCVEISTKPGSLEQVISDLIGIREVANEDGYHLPYDWWTCGGGAHIHVTNFDDSTDEAVKLFFLKYWSAPWAFAHYSNSKDGIRNPFSNLQELAFVCNPDVHWRNADSDLIDDEEEALSKAASRMHSNRENFMLEAQRKFESLNPDDRFYFYSSDEGREARDEADARRLTEMTVICEQTPLDVFLRFCRADLFTTSGPITVKRIDDETKTTEFRFFKATASAQEDRDHLEFIQAVYDYAEKNAEELFAWSRSLSVADYRRLRDKKPSQKSAIKNNFKSCLKVLGLDEKRYAPYMENLDLRIRFAAQQAKIKNAEAVLV